MQETHDDERETIIADGGKPEIICHYAKLSNILLIF